MNARLIIGALLLAVVLILALFGPALAPYEVSHATKIKTVDTADGVKIIGAPFPPSRDNLFGTDQWGYDILTLLLYGARYSVFCVLGVALLRVLIGGSIGLILGINSTRFKLLNMSALGGLPAFLFVYFFIFGININSTLSPMKLTIIQGILLVLLGVPGIISVISHKTVEIQKAQFIIAARTYGAGKLRLAFRHIYPALKENLIIMLAHEAIATLNTLGQLGLFNLFLGGTIFTPNPMLFHSITHEWAGLVGQSRLYFSYNQWILIFPLLAFMFFLLALFIFSRGLEEYCRAKYNPISHA